MKSSTFPAVFLSLMALASSQKLCSRKDPNIEKCLVPAAQEIVPLLARGLPKFGVFPFDPLHIDILDLSAAPGKTLHVRQKFMNVELTGLGSAVVKKVRIDFQKTKVEIEAVMTEPVTLVGNYVSEGKVLSLPIKGEGMFNITLVNQKATLTMKGHEVKKNGKTYVHMDSVRFPFTVDRLHLNFENLLNGNKEISDTINNVLNENWEAVLDDMKESFIVAIGAAFKEIANRIFTKLPVGNIIKDY